MTGRHDHNEINSQYCPICGDKLQEKPVTQTIENLSKTFNKKTYKIYLNRSIANQIWEEQENPENLLSETVAQLDAPVHYTTGNTPSEITIIKQAGTGSHKHYRTINQLSQTKNPKTKKQLKILDGFNIKN